LPTHSFEKKKPRPSFVRPLYYVVTCVFLFVGVLKSNAVSKLWSCVAFKCALKLEASHFVDKVGMQKFEHFKRDAGNSGFARGVGQPQERNAGMRKLKTD
jgi:hypothetical protein